MNNLLIKGHIVSRKVAMKLSKPLSNHRADDNAQEGGRGFMKLSTLLIVGGVVLTILTVVVAGSMGKLPGLTKLMDDIGKIKTTNP